MAINHLSNNLAGMLLDHNQKCNHLHPKRKKYPYHITFVKIFASFPIFPLAYQVYQEQLLRNIIFFLLKSSLLVSLLQFKITIRNEKFSATGKSPDNH